jgi:sugar lactone lactonase YvrE
MKAVQEESFLYRYERFYRREYMFQILKHRAYRIRVWGTVLALLGLLLMAANPMGEFPPVLPLPNGFQPEGIAVGVGTTYYVGSIPTGAIFRGDLETGVGDVFIQGKEGRQAVGLKFDPRSNLLFVAGGATGMAFVYNAVTGADVAQIQLTAQTPTFINDVVVTPDAAYFTDSSRPVFYRVTLQADGSLPQPVEVRETPLTGDFVFFPDGFNANGVVASPHGSALLIVNSTQGSLYRVNTSTGMASLVDLGGQTVVNGDGLLLDGTTLYVVQNQDNQISVVALDENWWTGTITGTIKTPTMRVPTTLARYENWLYAVNARFGTEPTPDTAYEVIQIPME